MLLLYIFFDVRRSEETPSKQRQLEFIENKENIGKCDFCGTKKLVLKYKQYRGLSFKLHMNWITILKSKEPM